MTAHLGRIGYGTQGVRTTTLGEVHSTTRLRILLGLLALSTFVLVIQIFSDEPSVEPLPKLTFSQLVDQVESGQVDEVMFTQGSSIVTGELRNGVRFETVIPPGYSSEIVDTLLQADPAIEITTEAVSTAPSVWMFLLTTIAPLAVMMALVWLIWRRMGGAGSARKFKARTRKLDPEQLVTFADVAGADEAVTELSEIRDFLSDPQRFITMGAKIPKGVLLYGPPGTGKTLLARAVAGEAGVPFYTLSGSDFVELYAGVGASRVRELFEEAKKEAPAIIFVDEIDAVGRHRGGGGGAGNEEREQTVLVLRYGLDLQPPRTLSDVGDRLGITRERPATHRPHARPARDILVISATPTGKTHEKRTRDCRATSPCSETACH